MGRVLTGYGFFALIGVFFGYVLATGYLQARLTLDLGYFYLLTDWRGLWAARADLFEHSAIIIGICAFAGLALGVYFVSERLTAFGTTHWQGRAELRANGFHQALGTGFLLGKTSGPKGVGRFIAAKKFPHCLVVAPTGRGKGVGFVIPNLLTFKGSTVTLDVKGENFEKTARRRRQLGDTIIRFAPTDFEVDSHRYNPLLRIYAMANPNQQLFELKKLATQFLQTENAANESFLRGGIDIFLAAALLAFERGKPTMGEIYRIVNGGAGDYNTAYAVYAGEAQREDGQRLWQALAKVVDKTLSAYVSLLNTSGLSVWQNGHVDAVTSETDIDFADLRRHPHSVYLTIRSQDIEPMAGLIRLFFSDLIASLEHHEPDPQTEPWPVMIILDEFHKLGKMPIVSESITTLRSYGGRLAIITQTIPKLDEIYGRNERLSLEGGAGLKLYMTPSEELTVENLSEACGKTTKRVVSKSRGPGFAKSATVSERTEEVPLLTEDQARRMNLDDVVIVVDGGHPIRAKAVKYYADRTLQPIFDGQTGAKPTRTIAKSDPKVQGLEARLASAEKRLAEYTAGSQPADELSLLFAAETEALLSKLTERLQSVYEAARHATDGCAALSTAAETSALKEPLLPKRSRPTKRGRATPIEMVVTEKMLEARRANAKTV